MTSCWVSLTPNQHAPTSVTTTCRSGGMLSSCSAKPAGQVFSDASFVVGVVASCAALTKHAKQPRTQRRACRQADDGERAAQAILSRAGGRTSTPWFDPLGLCESEESYRVSRDWEMTTGRVAMLAAVGYPAAEMWHQPLASAVGLPNLLTENGQAPHALNGGSLHPVLDAVVFVSLAGILAAFGETVANGKKGDALHASLNPRELRLAPTLSPTLRCLLREAQRVNGRAAMVAVTAMIVVEGVTGQPIASMTS
eukprot:TRINITY_DN7490_c0_g1_i1.p2 TRINITY_DN7490_c0_g1~~TRINITY_DN7490_c0_g1_i1.p2  ORF type:complete len:254 (-),score=29.22 TRINITY_DN7490_c0_g1_i1:241-1002(-)